MKIETKAYAKVNLHLDVLNKRKDGYHNIFSLNASVDLFDILIFNKINVSDDSSQDISIEIIPAGGKYSDIIQSVDLKDNLITQAVTEYLNKIGKSGEISVSIKKDIPAGAGLGGGSSDAAAALRILNEYLKVLEESELVELGLKIGADIPYCLTSGFAICEGLGDEIQGLPGRLDHYVLIVNSGIHVNTAWAYRSLNRQFEAAGDALKSTQEKRIIIRDSIEKGSISSLSSFLKNDFEEPVFAEYPEIKRLKEEIEDSGADYVTMTGSGSSIIGLFKDIDRAKNAEASLSKKAEHALLSRFI